MGKPNLRSGNHLLTIISAEVGAEKVKFTMVSGDTNYKPVWRTFGLTSKKLYEFYWMLTGNELISASKELFDELIGVTFEGVISKANNPAFVNLVKVLRVLPTHYNNTKNPVIDSEVAAVDVGLKFQGGSHARQAKPILPK